MGPMRVNLMKTFEFTVNRAVETKLHDQNQNEGGDTNQNSNFSCLISFSRENKLK